MGGRVGGRRGRPRGGGRAGAGASPSFISSAHSDSPDSSRCSSSGGEVTSGEGEGHIEQR